MVKAQKFDKNSIAEKFNIADFKPFTDKIFAVLKGESEAKTIVQISKETGLPNRAVDLTLDRLLERGKVKVKKLDKVTYWYK